MRARKDSKGEGREGIGEKFNFQGQKRASVKAKKGGLKQKFKVICQFF